MVRRKGSGGVGGGGGGSDIDLTGYATEMWTEENYVGKEFFSSLFRAYDANGNEILPNDTDSTIDNIKAMFSFWTNFAITALGTGGQSTVGLRLSQLDDVNVAGVTNGQALVYDSTSQKWVPGTISGGSVAWNNITNKPTTISGYGITDCYISNGTITIGSNSITPTVGSFLPLSGGTLTGSLDIKSNARCTYMLFWNTSMNDSAGYVGRGGSETNTIYLVGYTGNAVCIGANSGNDIFIDTNHNVGIGTTNISYKLHVVGTIGCTNVLATGYVSALSDTRHKNIQGDVALTVEMVAKAPAVKFTWKDEKKPGLFVGSLAQYWQKALPEVVHSQADGTLTLDYQVTALMAAIVTARKVEDHESRLRRLEKMFALNENDIED